MSLEIILGPMFAGKSTTILGTLRRHAFIGRKTLCITSYLDKRYSMEAKIITHDKDSYPALAVDNLTCVLENPAFTEAKCIIIEEAQFFPDLFTFVLDSVEKYNKQVICVGLDGDAKRRQFGQLLDLIPYADQVSKYAALCARCMDGTKALFTSQKVIDPSVAQISVGGEEKYEPLCRKHYLEHNK